MEGTGHIEIQQQIGQPRTHQMRFEDICAKLSSKNDWIKFFKENL